MLNYISAELWRCTRRWTNLAGWGCFLLLVAVAGVTWGTGGMVYALETLREFLMVGLYVGFPLAALTCGDLWRSGTLGNELSVGLTRRRIYFGKLLASLLMGVVLFFATVVVFLLAAAPWGAQAAEDQVRAAMGYLMEGIWISLPRYIGVVSLAQCLCFSLRATGMAPVLYYIYISLGELFLGSVNLYNIGPVGDVLNALAAIVRPFLLGSAYFTYGNLTVPPPAPGIGMSWLTGLGWVVVSSAVGMAVFSRREIK